MEGLTSVNHFTNLIAWQKSHAFVRSIYEISKKFPQSEQFGLTSQLRRAASSITANIAEGYGRYHFKDKIRFYYLARGSNTESQNHIILAHDLGYITNEEFYDLKFKVWESYKILSGLISATTNQDDRKAVY